VHVVIVWSVVELRGLGCNGHGGMQVCFQQNIHGRSLADIKVLAGQYEEAPSTYSTASATALFEDSGRVKRRAVPK